MISIAIENGKGGVAKTTTSVHLAAGFAMSGLRVLLIDIDPQASIKSYFKIKLEKGNTLDFILGKYHQDSIYPVDINIGSQRFKMDVMPSSQRMQDFDDKTTGIPRREEILKYRIEEEELYENYDVIVIDCPPTLNLAIKNVLTFADYLLIPSEMEGMSVTGVHTVINSVQFMYKYIKRKPKILGILPTKYDQRQRVSKDLYENCNEMFPGVKVFEPIRIDSKIRKAYLQKKTVYECDPSARVSKEYLRLTKEIIKIADLKNKMAKETHVKSAQSTTSEKLMEL